MNPTNEELAKWCEDEAAFWTEDDGTLPFAEDARMEVAKHLSLIASRLRIPEGHVALPGGLTFDALRSANVARAERWRNGAERPPLSFAMMELAGETGEACNEAKKRERAERGMVGGKIDDMALADELADVVICADLAAERVGIDLAAAVARKFNKTSAKHGFPDRLPDPALAARAKEGA